MALVFGIHSGIIGGERSTHEAGVLFYTPLVHNLISSVASKVPQRTKTLSELTAPQGVCALWDFALNAEKGAVKMNSNRLSEIGKLFPHRYLEELGTDLFQTLFDTLKRQEGASADLVDALDVALTLIQYAHWIETGSLKELFYKEIPLTVAQAVNCLEGLDGSGQGRW